MCIAIVKPKGVSISKEILETCHKNNKDGIGFSYIDKDKMYIKKFMKFDEFYKEFEKVQNASNMIIHFRIATHGKVEVNNCHPFWLNHRMALIHNGVISGYGDKDNKTDTQDFIDKVIGNISWKEWKNPCFRELVGKAIGYSKLAILDITGNYYIINEKFGEWSDGIWYSNTSYKPKQTTSYVVNKDCDTWDMYGEESYDDWYQKGKEKNLKKSSSSRYLDGDVVYRCEKCKNEFVKGYEIENVCCDKCASKNVKDVGFIYRDEVYYYDKYLKNNNKELAK